MSFSWPAWRKRRGRQETPSLNASPRLGALPPGKMDDEKTSALGRAARGSAEDADDEVTSSYERPSIRPALCGLDQVAVVSAVMASADAAAFELLVDGAEGVFSVAGGCREERLRALAALRTRAALNRMTMISKEMVPPWARGRMPASVAPIGTGGPLPTQGVRQAVDAALAARNESTGPGFGEWCPPGIVIELD